MTSTLLKGTVQQGGTFNRIPIPNATVTIYHAGTGDPLPAGRTTTGSDGTFSVNVESDSSSGIFYAVADLGYGVKLATSIGPSLLDSITINELTTVSRAIPVATESSSLSASPNHQPLSTAETLRNKIPHR